MFKYEFFHKKDVLFLIIFKTTYNQLIYNLYKKFLKKFSVEI